MIPSNPESSSVSLCAQGNSPGSLPEKEADRKSYDDSGSESEDEEERSEHEDGHRLDSVGDEDDGDEDKDYDEVVVKPRPLNEVTSLTDKTSPWTSVLSDLDTVSLESMEETNERNLSPAVGEKLQILNQQTSDCREQNECDGLDANRSTVDASDADCGDERTRQTEETRQDKESESPTDVAHEKSLSPHKQEPTANHNTPSSQDKQPQTYPYCVCAAVVWDGFSL